MRREKIVGVHLSRGSPVHGTVNTVIKKGSEVSIHSVLMIFEDDRDRYSKKSRQGWE